MRLMVLSCSPRDVWLNMFLDIAQALHTSARVFKIKCPICTENGFIWHCFKSKHISKREHLHDQQTFQNRSKVKIVMTAANVLFGVDKTSKYFKTSPPIIFNGKSKPWWNVRYFFSGLSILVVTGDFLILGAGGLKHPCVMLDLLRVTSLPLQAGLEPRIPEAMPCPSSFLSFQVTTRASLISLLGRASLA